MKPEVTAVEIGEIIKTIQNQPEQLFEMKNMGEVQVKVTRNRAGEFKTVVLLH